MTEIFLLIPADKYVIAKEEFIVLTLVLKLAMLENALPANMKVRW